MPRPSQLSLDEAQNHTECICACGCGQSVNSSSYQYASAPEQFYASNACRQKAYRKRLKEGRVIDLKTRKRQQAAEEAQALRAQAKELKGRIASLQAELGRIERMAEKQEKLAAGQQLLFGEAMEDLHDYLSQKEHQNQ